MAGDYAMFRKLDFVQRGFSFVDFGRFGLDPV